MRTLKEGLDLLLPRGKPDPDYARRPVELGDVNGRDFDKAVEAAVALEIGRAVAAEREACAKVVEDIARLRYLQDIASEEQGLDEVAAAIRARGETKPDAPPSVGMIGTLAGPPEVLAQIQALYPEAKAFACYRTEGGMVRIEPYEIPNLWPSSIQPKSETKVIDERDAPAV